MSSKDGILDPQHIADLFYPSLLVLGTNTQILPLITYTYTDSVFAFFLSVSAEVKKVWCWLCHL